MIPFLMSAVDLLPTAAVAVDVDGFLSVFFF
jgi:hypothetical protein